MTIRQGCRYHEELCTRLEGAVRRGCRTWRQLGKRMNLKCFACGGDVIWGGDHDTEDDEACSSSRTYTARTVVCLSYVSPTPNPMSQAHRPIRVCLTHLSPTSGGWLRPVSIVHRFFIFMNFIDTDAELESTCSQCIVPLQASR